MNCHYKLCQNLAVDSKICPNCCRYMYCSTECLQLDREAHRSYCIPSLFILKDLVPIKNTGKSMLGRGAYGEVQLVQHAKSKSLYALKTINKSSMYQTPIEVILREISVHKSLIHPNIVRLYGHIEDKNKIYLILEYVEKGSLYKILQKKDVLKESEACEYFKQACIGVRYLHSCNIIHRDIKSENLLVSKDCVVKLCDFGWCAIGIQPRSTYCGTVDYMAPEMSQSEFYDNKVDIWALGILLYELLHGRPPFVCFNGISNLKEVNSENLIIKNELSDSAAGLIRRILNVNPDLRPNVLEILKSPWFSENIACKLRVGNVLKHPELGEGTVINTEGNVCCIEFSKSNLEMPDTEALRICEVKKTRSIVFKSLEPKSKPPLCRISYDKMSKIPLIKVRSSKAFLTSYKLEKLDKMNSMNTSAEFLPPERAKSKPTIERTFYDISLSPSNSRDSITIPK